MPGAARSVKRPSTSLKACCRSTPNLWMSPKNWCVSVMADQACRRPSASRSASGAGGVAAGAGVNWGAASRSVNWATMSLNTSRSVSARTKILCTAVPCASKNCRLWVGGFSRLLAGSITANPACHLLKNRRRSISCPRARPMWPVALMLWYTPIFSCTTPSLRVSAITGPHSSSACSSSTHGPRRGVACRAWSCAPAWAATAWPSLTPMAAAASMARWPLCRAARKRSRMSAL